MTRWQLRMPDGALYDVEEVEHDREHSLVRLVDDPDPERGDRLRVPRDWLIEAQPPSIDEPVDLPLLLTGEGEVGIYAADEFPIDDDAIAVLRVVDPEIGDRAALVGLTADETLAAARALFTLWKQATGAAS